MIELRNCPICGGLVEDGACEGHHFADRAERIEQDFKSWVAGLQREASRDQD